MIKRIGTAAREELERFFGTRVFLDLHVRVKSEWREDDAVLDDIGLGRDGTTTVARLIPCDLAARRSLDAALHHRRADSADLQAR